MADYQIRTSQASAAREIKASAHYSYVTNGITLDGTKFTAGELVLEGQCLVKDNTTGKYEKYVETTPGTFPTGKSDPVILDESVLFNPIAGVNPDVVVGQVLVHGAVYSGMLKGVTEPFKTKLAGAIRFV